MAKVKSHEARILTYLLKVQDRWVTTSEIADKAGMSWNTAERQLDILENRGWVKLIRYGRSKRWKAVVEE